jgi:hypothetical protein
MTPMVRALRWPDDRNALGYGHSFEFAVLDVTLYDPRVVPKETAVLLALYLGAAP